MLYVTCMLLSIDWSHMIVDWTLRVGDIAEILAIIGGVVAVFFGMRADIRVVKHDLKGLNDKVAMMATAWEKMGDVLTKVAVQDTRLNRIEDDVRELRHGDGYVIRNPRT